MSYALSNPAVASLMAEATREIWLRLLTISHADWPTPIRLVDDTVDIVSRGTTFTAYGFEIAPAPEVPDQLPRIEMVVDNVGQLLTAALESLQSPPTVMIEIIMASSPDTLERGPWVYQVNQIQYDASHVRAELNYEPLVAEPFPWLRFTPTKFPGLFNAVDR